MARVFPNRVWMTTSTTGTGTITLGSAKDNSYLTASEAGVANGDIVGYEINDGTDIEIGIGTYTSSGTTLSRNVVSVSKISGTSGTTKITLSGSATVFLTPIAADFGGIVNLASDNTVSTTALADVTGMSFTADASATYIVELIGTFQTAATTTGIGLALNIPSGAVQGQVYAPINNTSANVLQQVADDAVLAASTGVAVFNTNYPITGRWLVKIDTTGGTVQLRQRSEVAASNTVLKAGTATIAGTVMSWKRVF